HRAALVAVLARHAAALGNVAGELTLTDRARVAMHLLDAVRGPLALEVVADHDAGGAAALGDADDVDPFDFGQVIDIELLPDFQAFDRAAEFADEALRLATGFGQRFDAGLGLGFRALAVELGNVTADTATGQAAGLIAEA